MCANNAHINSAVSPMMPILSNRIRNASAVRDELVLPYAMAQEALTSLELSGVEILGWEGWLRSADGRLGHSALHQGTADLSGMDSRAAYELCRATMADAYSMHLERPEREATELLFCLTHGG